MSNEFNLDDYRSLTVVELTLLQLALSSNEYLNLIAARCPTLTPAFGRDELHDNPLMDKLMEESLTWERELSPVTFEQALIATQIFVDQSDGPEASCRMINDALSLAYDSRCILEPVAQVTRVYEHLGWTKAEIELDTWATEGDFAERLYAARSQLTHAETLQRLASNPRIPHLQIEAIANLDNERKVLLWDRTSVAPAPFDLDFFARQIEAQSRAEMLREF